MDRIIDVAQIMRDIRAQIIPNANESFIPDLESENRLLVSNRNELNRIFDFIENTRRDSNEHLAIGSRLPSFNRFNTLVKRLLLFLVRIVRKATRFITRDQIIVNQNVDVCLKALVESNMEIFRAISAVHNDTAKLHVPLHVPLEEQLTTLQTKVEEIHKNATTVLPPEMYMRFEDQFRGKEEEIRRRQNYYLEKYISQHIQNAEDDTIIDLGCGRGEWLNLLKEKGFHAKGVDSNEAMIQTCQAKGLDVVLADAIYFLRMQESNTIKALSSYQLIEHLHLWQLSELLLESYRVLKPGGIMILETPNPNNVEVGSSAFYIDPTHKRPVHQEYLAFLAKEIGFNQVEITYWKQDEIQNWFDSIVSSDEDTISKSAMLRTLAESVKKVVYASPDYALIAIK
jgi:O-antigen chain-terminating methyltransferase